METFVVRVWRPAGGSDDPAGTNLRGTVLHPASGLEAPFTCDAELIRLLRGEPMAAGGAPWSRMPASSPPPPQRVSAADGLGAGGGDLRTELATGGAGPARGEGLPDEIGVGLDEGLDALRGIR